MSIEPNSTVQGSAPRRIPLSRRVLAGALAVAALVGVAAVLVIGRGNSTAGQVTKAATTAHVAHSDGAARSAVHTGAIGAREPANDNTHLAASGKASATTPKGVAVAEVRDPEEAKSFPLPASTRHASASSPSVAGEAAIAPGAASDAEVRKELGEEARAKAQERAAQHRVLTPVAGGFSVGGDGTIPIPQNIPEAVQRVVAGGNAIADFPYIWGG
ncbi:MAG TPA: hypothetical protein VIG42_09240, partial [Solirubrobacteraceae bacterium]